MIVNDVISALVALFDSAVSAPVFDGPDMSAANNETFVLVGSTGEADDGAILDLEASTMGPGTWRSESGVVTCSAFAWFGGTDIPTVRATALELAEACATAVHADRTLGGLLVEPTAMVSGFTYQPRQESAGSSVRVIFDVSYRALLT